MDGHFRTVASVQAHRLQLVGPALIAGADPTGCNRWAWRTAFGAWRAALEEAVLAHALGDMLSPLPRLADGGLIAPPIRCLAPIRLPTAVSGASSGVFFSFMKEGTHAKAQRRKGRVAYTTSRLCAFA